MNEPRAFLLKLQIAVYLLEAGVLAGVLALAGGGSSDFPFGPIGRAVAAAALPLPCHLLLLLHVAWAGSQRQVREARAAGLFALPLPLPARVGIAHRYERARRAVPEIRALFGIIRGARTAG